jgi:ACS family pantothenate transporter-like MFS transporter
MPSPEIGSKPEDTQVDVSPEKEASSLTSENSPAQAEPKHSWRSYIWDVFDKPPEERRFLYKFDAIVLTMTSLGFFIKVLDQYNINSAFVSGMREDLSLFGNELNYMTSMYTAGYIIGQIPRSDTPFS